MTAKSHMLSIGIFSLLPLSYFGGSIYSDSGIDTTVKYSIFVVFMLLGSILPDVDEPGSKIGRAVPAAIPHIIKALFGHRGITHTVAFLLPWIIAYYFSEGMFKIAMLGILLGSAAHILGDMLTKGGVINLFYPFTPNTTFGLLPKSLRFYTSSLTEVLFVRPALLIVFLFSVYRNLTVYFNQDFLF